MFKKYLLLLSAFTLLTSFHANCFFEDEQDKFISDQDEFISDVIINALKERDKIKKEAARREADEEEAAEKEKNKAEIRALIEKVKKKEAEQAQIKAAEQLKKESYQAQIEADKKAWWRICGCR